MFRHVAAPAPGGKEGSPKGKGKSKRRPAAAAVQGDDRSVRFCDSVDTVPIPHERAKPDCGLPPTSECGHHIPCRLHASYQRKLGQTRGWRDEHKARKRATAETTGVHHAAGTPEKGATRQQTPAPDHDRQVAAVQKAAGTGGKNLPSPPVTAPADTGARAASASRCDGAPGKGQTALEDRLWLLDTGCPVDLVQTSSLPAKLLNRREPAGQNITLETANGANRAWRPLKQELGARARNRRKT